MLVSFSKIGNTASITIATSSGNMMSQVNSFFEVSRATNSLSTVSPAHPAYVTFCYISEISGLLIG